jgi:RNA polymerase sigma-32 factor
VSVEQIRAHSARLAMADVSLDAKVSDDGDTTALDLLASEWMSPEEEASVAQRDELVHQVVERVGRGFDARERALVSQRLLADESLTLAELGTRFRLSRERLRQLEMGVKARLRRALEVDLPGLE